MAPLEAISASLLNQSFLLDLTRTVLFVMKGVCRFQLISLFVIYFSARGIAQEEMSCQGLPVNLNDHQKAQITECMESSGIKSIWKIPVDKLACLGVCILEKKEMLTPEGKLNHEKATAYVEAALPPQVRKPIMDGVDKCIKEHGEKVKMDNDPKCMSFMEVGQCVHDVFFDICVV